MFTPPDNLEEAESPQLPSVADMEARENNQADDDVHTMPNRFLKPTDGSKRKGKVSWLILGLVIIIVLGAVIAAAVMFLGRQTGSPDSQEPTSPGFNQPNVNQTVNANNNVNGENENINLNQNTNVNQNLDTATGRDNKKLGDISVLRTALALYFKTYQVFPNSLSSLLGKFIAELPQNPSDVSGNYNYQPASGQQDYILSFSLESAAEWGILLLSAGDYYANTEGIFPGTGAEPVAEANLNTNSELPEEPPVINNTPVMGLDSDGDQLTDIEENVYQTNATLADTDGDSYTDAIEILNFYNPLDPAGRLVNSGLTELYQNPDYNYSVVYPGAWVVRSLTANNTEIIFTSNTGEFVEIIVQQNPLSLSAMNWYLSQNPTVNSGSLETLVIDGFPAVQTADGLTTYLAVGSNIYIIAYNIGTQFQMNFYSTYQLFLRSFMFLETQ